ncbi:MAG: DUF72 domain-containing protein [Nitrososphaerota archaeon]
MSRIYIGTSGWSYTDWENVFYKTGEHKLKKYSTVFSTVEIDSTFYTYPSPSLVKGLLNITPEDFLFTAKLPSIITHEKKLDISKGVEKDLDRFLELMQPLLKAGRLASLLIQLPPSYSYEKHYDVFKQFLELTVGEYRYAVEFRDTSWMREDVLNLLSKYEVAYTIVDEPLLPPNTYVTTDFAYIRWHGRGRNPWYYYHYDLVELYEWKTRIMEIKGKVKKVYGYFNNHFKGYAVHNALQVLEILEIITPTQRKILEEVEKNLIEAKIQRTDITLYTPPENLSENIEGLLAMLTDKTRLKRAKEISKSLIEVREATEQYLSARVKYYNVIIDLEKRIIIHDCADWSKLKASRSLCKHLNALILNIDETFARRILEDLVINRGLWVFSEDI